MKKDFLYILTAVFILCSLIISVHPIFSTDPNEQKQVLILFSNSLGTPWQSQTRKSLYKGLSINPNINIIAKFPWSDTQYNESSSELLFEFYKNKFQNIKFDVVIPVSTYATLFMLEYGDRLFPEIPVVALPGSSKERLEYIKTRPNWTGVFADKKIMETIDIALELQPKTENIAIISGSSSNAKTLEINAREIAKKYNNDLNFIYLTDMPMDDIVHKTAYLPDNTVILYLLTLLDSEGNTFIPKNILKDITESANAPVYALWDTLMESAVLGGYMVSPHYEGKALANTTLRIIGGENVESIPFNLSSNKYFFDWNQMEKWNIQEQNLPADSIILNKHYSLWNLYKKQIIFIISIILIQSFLIVTLLILQSRLRRVRKSLSKSHKELESKVIDRTKDLTVSNTNLNIEINNHKTAKDQVQALLEEKELILSEVHHRIKNNMTTVMQLLFMQSTNMKNEEAVNSLKNAGNRIQSMMLLYDKLYRGSVFENMKVKDYLETLITEIIGNLDISNKILIETNIEDFVLDSKTIFNLGIILNELITNIVKYAFPDEKGGNITLSASIYNNHISIIIQDNGIGLPEDFDIEKSQGFGLSLVNMLIIQLEGVINIDKKEGTKFTLEFEKN